MYMAFLFSLLITISLSQMGVNATKEPLDDTHSKPHRAQGSPNRLLPNRPRVHKDTHLEPHNYNEAQEISFNGPRRAHGSPNRFLPSHESTFNRPRAHKDTHLEQYYNHHNEAQEVSFNGPRRAHGSPNRYLPSKLPWQTTSSPLK